MAKKQLEDDLLTGGSLAKDDKTAKKEAKKAEKAKKLREKNDAKRAEIKKQIDALKEEKKVATDEKTIAQLDSKIKKLYDKYSSVGADNGVGVAPRTAKIVKSVVCIVLVVALLVTYFSTGLVRKGFVASLGIPAQYFTGMTVTDGEQKAKIKVSTYNYYFAMQYNNMRNMQEQYAKYGLDPKQLNLDVDFEKRLSQQTTENDEGEEVTWAEYMHDKTVEAIEDTYTYYLDAVKANDGKEPEITDEQKKELKETVAEYRKTAEGYGYTLSGYLVQAFGKGVTENVFKQEATRSYIAENYKQELKDEYSSKEYSKDNYDKYLKANKDNLISVDAKFFECENEDDAKAFKKALKADGSNFADLCSKYASTDFEKKAYKNDGYSTEYGITKEILKNKGYAIAVADEHEHKDGDDDKHTYKGLDWLFSKERKAGDIYQTSTTVVYVLSPAALRDDKTVNVRHILVAPKTDKEDSEAITATDEQWSAAYDEAKKLLNEWKSGDKTEDSFAKLATKNTADTGSAKNGGLYENVVPGQMVNSFSAWSFDDSRKAGDTGIVKSDYGFHIMYFVGEGDLKIWEYTAQQSYASDDSTDALDKLEEAYTVKENWFGSRYFEKDVDIDN